MIGNVNANNAVVVVLEKHADFLRDFSSGQKETAAFATVPLNAGGLGLLAAERQRRRGLIAVSVGAGNNQRRRRRLRQGRTGTGARHRKDP